MNFKKLYIHFPIIILLCEWLIVLYLHYTNPYHFVTMSKDTLQILLVGLLFIVTGYYFINSFYLKSNLELPGDNRAIKINEALLGKIVLLLSVVSLIGLMVMLKEIAKITNNFSMYFQNPLLARERIVLMQEGKLATASYFLYKIGLYLFSFMYPIAAVGGVVSLFRSKWRLIGLVPLIFLIAYSLIHLNRVNLITGLGLWFFSRIYFSMFLDRVNRRRASKNTVIGLIIGVTFIIVFFYFIMRVRSSSDINLKYYTLRNVYSYLTGSGAAFERFLFEGFKPLYGASSFRSIFKWLATFGFVNDEIVLGVHNSFVNIGQGRAMRLNTYTFVKSPYEDFGIVGVAVTGMIWGMVTRYSVQRCFKGFSFVNIFLVAMMILSLFMTFFEFFFQGIVMFAYWFIIVFLFEKYLSARKAI